jgi:beta-glucosidase
MTVTLSENMRQPLDIDSLLQELSSEEKIALLSGDDMWHTVAIERAGIPRVRVSNVA